MKLSAQTLKYRLPAEQYYNKALKGSFGKATGNGWHKWDGLCPFHNDKYSGSFVINKFKGSYKCFSCGKHGGDIIAFHMAHNRLGFYPALRELTKGLS